MPLILAVQTQFHSYFLQLDKVGTRKLHVELRAIAVKKKQDSDMDIAFDVNEEE